MSRYINSDEIRMNPPLPSQEAVSFKEETLVEISAMTQPFQPSQFIPLAEAPRAVDDIKAQELASQLPFWNAAVAFQLGCALRARLLTFDKPACIHISTISTPPHVLFHSVTHTGTVLDNDYWISRKRNAVIRWGASTWRLHNQFEGNEEQFAKKLGLGEGAKDYAIHGGGVPIFVKGIEGMVAVVVVSGLKQWDDHMVVIEELGNVCKSLDASGQIA